MYFFLLFFFFFFNDTATTEIYTLSLHDALPISRRPLPVLRALRHKFERPPRARQRDRKSTRLNSSHLVISLGHLVISYAVFCLKKKKKTNIKHFNIKKIIIINNN